MESEKMKWTKMRPFQKGGLNLVNLKLNFYLIVGSALILIIFPLLLIYLKQWSFLKALLITLGIVLFWILINIFSFKTAEREFNMIHRTKPTKKT